MPFKFLGREIRIGLQLYTIRDYCEHDLRGSLASVANMGYEGVEFAGFHGFTAVELRNHLSSLGIVCCGSHVELADLQYDNLDKTIEYNMVLGNPYLICAYIKLDKISEWRTMAMNFTSLAGHLEAKRMHIGYHNHAHDLSILDGQTPWHVFFDNTSPQVLMQLDSGNALGGGVDPVSILRRYPHRSPTVHIKDFTETDANVLIGEGNLKVMEFISACASIGGSQWLIVEVENPEIDSLVAAQRCLKNLNMILA